MAPKLSQFSGAKRVKKIEILTHWKNIEGQYKLKKDALEAVALEFDITPNQVRMMLRRYRPQEEANLRLHKNSLLTFDEEAEVVGLILGMANIAKPLDIKTLLAIVTKLHEAKNISFGRKWFYGFYSRWSTFFSKAKSQLISASRSNVNNLQGVDGFIAFHEWYRGYIDYPPHTIFNVDETRVSISEAKRAGAKLVAKGFSKSGTLGKRENQHCSVVPFVSAAGEVISVFSVLASTPGQPVLSVPQRESPRSKQRWCEYYVVTPNGYTSDDVFPNLVAQFELDFHKLYPDTPAVIYADRLSSHTTPELLATTSAKQLTFVLFPAGTSHFLQPLDDVVFGLFKTKLRMYRDELLASNPFSHSIVKDSLLKAMMLAVQEALQPGLITAAFLNTGIYPWDSEKISARRAPRPARPFQRRCRATSASPGDADGHPASQPPGPTGGDDKVPETPTGTGKGVHFGRPCSRP